MSEQKWTAEPWEWDCNNIEQVGSPWKSIMEPEVLCGAWCQGGMVSLNISDADKARVIQCVNACAGIHDPAAAIREAREALSDVLAATAPIIDAWDSACLVDGEHEFSEYETQAERLQRSIDMISAALRALGGCGQ